MVYCKKCARLLDEDVRVCPYCENEDDTAIDETQIDDTADRLRQIDEQIAKNLAAQVIEPPTPTEQATPITPALLPPGTIPPPVHTSAQRAVPVPEEKPSAGLYVGMICLSIFLTIPGLIVGIVYMTNKNPAYRKMGLIMLLISIVFTLIWCISCCGLLYAIGSTTSTLIY